MKNHLVLSATQLGELGEKITDAEINLRVGYMKALENYASADSY